MDRGLHPLIPELPTYFPNIQNVRILGNTFGYHMLQKRAWMDSLTALLRGIHGIKTCSFTMSLQGFSDMKPMEPDPTLLEQRMEEFGQLTSTLQKRLNEGGSKRQMVFSYETCPPVGLWDRPNLPFHPLVWM